jgi:hypothetical protein
MYTRIRSRIKNVARGLLSFTPWAGKGWSLVPRLEWSIGFVRAASPLPDESGQPTCEQILTRRDVADARSELVADPFLLHHDDVWHLFFETFSVWRGRGEIAVARSDDLKSWKYMGIVLREPFHLSYPYVFEHDGAIFMVPETARTKSVRLYRATAFPERWTFERTLLSGQRYYDPSLIYHDERWWLFAETAPKHRYDTLRLFHARNLDGQWAEHSASPIVAGDPSSARPAGRILRHEGRLYRFAQDCSASYGRSVSAFHITELSLSDYSECRIEPAILCPGPEDWRSLGMHHYDAQRVADGSWIAAVDGFGRL